MFLSGCVTIHPSETFEIKVVQAQDLFTESQIADYYSDYSDNLLTFNQLFTDIIASGFIIYLSKDY